MPNLNKIGRSLVGELTSKEKIFAYEYLCNGRNATQAYITAYGVPYNTAKAEGYRLLQSDRVRNFIKTKDNDMFQRYDLSLDRITQELAACGFSNATDVIGLDGDGQAIYSDTRVLDEGTQRAIAEINVIGGKVNVKMHDKVKALQSLAKYQGAELEFNQIIIALDRMGFDVIKGGNGKLAFIERGGSVLSIDETIAKMIQLQESTVVSESVIEDVVNTLSDKGLDSEFGNSTSSGIGSGTVSELNLGIDNKDSIKGLTDFEVEQQSLLFAYPVNAQEEEDLAKSESKFDKKLDGILRENPYK